MTRITLKKNPLAKQISRSFERLLNVMFTLRSEDGCPWDRAQDLKDLRQYLLEESYELLHGLDSEDPAVMKEELGDLLFQIVFISQMMQERNAFTLLEVLEELNRKMIGRHPHVFGTSNAKNPDEALANWESMKSREKAEKEGSDRSILKGIPPELPALLQAQRISDKVTRVGFDWEKVEDVWKKLSEEIVEFHNAPAGKQKEEEMGDILFTLVNIARKHGMNAEDVLRSANLKFRDRFMSLERKVYSQNKDLTEMSLEELDELWKQVKEDFAVHRKDR